MQKIKNKIASAKKKIQDHAPELIVGAVAGTIVTLAIIVRSKSDNSPRATQEDDIDTCVSDNGQVMLTITDAGLAELKMGISNLFQFGNDVLALTKIEHPTE